MQIKFVKSVKSVGFLVKNTPKMSKICIMDSNDSFPINNQSRTMSSPEIVRGVVAPIVKQKDYINSF